MMPKVQFHGIESIELTPIEHFPPSPTCGHEFWSRELIVHGGEGDDVDPYTLHLYSYKSAASLELEVEKGTDNGA